MAAPDQTFAPPAHMLSRAGVLPAPEVAVAPTGGQGLSLEPDGTIPSSVIAGPLAGQVDSGGATVAGSGFTPARTGAGVYTVTYAAAFASTPSVQVTLAEDQPRLAPRVTAADWTLGFTVKFTTSGGVATDTAFSFAALSTS